MKLIERLFFAWSFWSCVYASYIGSSTHTWLNYFCMWFWGILIMVRYQKEVIEYKIATNNLKKAVPDEDDDKRSIQ